MAVLDGLVGCEAFGVCVFLLDSGDVYKAGEIQVGLSRDVDIPLVTCIVLAG